MALASVRVLGPPNSSFLVGYPGISATLPRIEGKVEIRPPLGESDSGRISNKIATKVSTRLDATQGYLAPVEISLVRIRLERKESIHPAAESITKRHLSAPRRETTDIVGKEQLLYRCATGRQSDTVVAMDLPFQLFIPFGRGGEETNRRIPPASLQLPSRIAETYYELVVTVQSNDFQKKHIFPVPLQRYDTMSTFGMYLKPESRQVTVDNIVTLGITMPRWSYGPSDPISVYIQLAPNPDWMIKARKVTIEKITIAIEEEITFNPEGDEPTKRINKLQKKTWFVNSKLPEAGYVTNLGMVVPSKDIRDSEGMMKQGKPAFPLYEIASFTTISTLYKIEFYLSVKAQMSGARDITVRQPIVISPLDNVSCEEEMDALEQAAKDASHVDPNNPMLPARSVVLANDTNSLRSLGLCMVGGQKKLLIE